MFQSSDIYSLIKSGRIQVKKTTSPPEYRFWNKVSKDGPIHPGGAQACLADGSVRFFSERMPLRTVYALGTRNGGEAFNVE